MKRSAGFFFAVLLLTVVSASVADVVSVDDLRLEGLNETTVEVFFTVTTSDGRTVRFSLFLDSRTLGFYGPVG